jgi:ABC-type phosphate/phosphonate transport system substrate-binding protein
MKRLMLVSIVLALLVSLTALAQDTTKPSNDRAKQDSAKATPQENPEKSASKTKAVTGCLQERRPAGPVFHHRRRRQELGLAQHHR